MQATTNHLTRRPVGRAGWVVSLMLVTLWGFLGATPTLGKKGKKKTAVGELNGRVLDTEDKALADVSVRMTSADGTSFSETATSDRKGMFTFRLTDPQGEYTVALAKEGFAPFEAEIPLGPGDTQNIDFRLITEAMGNRQRAVEAYNEGVQAFQGLDKAKAKTLFIEASTLDPSLAQAFFGLTDIYLEEEDFAAAASAAERYMALQPDDAKGKRLAYQAYLGLGDEDKQRVLRSALEDTDFADNLAVQTFNRGAIASQNGDLDEAVRQFRAALELDGELVAAYNGLASVYYNQEKYEQALAAVAELLQRDPDNLQGRRIRYLIHDVRNDQEQLAAAFDAYAEVDPANAAAVLHQRAELDFRSGDSDAALRNLEKVVALAPDMARAYYTLGLVYFSIDPTKAKQYLQKFIDMAPDDPEVPLARQMLTSE